MKYKNVMPPAASIIGAVTLYFVHNCTTNPDKYNPPLVLCVFFLLIHHHHRRHHCAVLTAGTIIDDSKNLYQFRFRACI